MLATTIAVTGVVIASLVAEVGVAGLLILVGIAAIIVARTAKDLKATLPGMKFEIGQINRAVNHIPDGSPTLIEQVREISEWKNRQEAMVKGHIKLTNEMGHDLQDRIGSIERKLINTNTTIETPVIVIPMDYEGKLDLGLDDGKLDLGLE